MTVRSITVRYFQGNGIFICGGTRASSCSEPVSRVTVSHVTVNGNEDNGIYVRGSNINRATVQHSYVEGNDGNGISLIAPSGVIGGPQIKNCTVVYNRSAIVISGDDIVKAKLTSNTASRNSSGTGITLDATSQIIRPTLSGNTSSDNPSGIGLYANQNIVNPNISNNHAAGNRTRGIVAYSQGDFNGGQFKGNVVTGNSGWGIWLYGDTSLVKVKLQNNRVVDSSNSGIELEGSNIRNNQIKNNTTSDNGSDGIRLEGTGQGNMIQGNQVIGNQNMGINIYLNNTNNQIKSNTVRGNDGDDLNDENGNCDSNTWKNNTFVTRNQDCIK